MKNALGIKLLSTTLFVYLTFMSGCYYDSVVIELPEGPVSYSAQMQPFFDAKCVGCHNGSSAPLNLDASVSYDNLISGGTPPYVDVADPSASKLYTKIAPGGSMEPYASATDVSITLQWIEQGAENN